MKHKFLHSTAAVATVILLGASAPRSHAAPLAVGRVSAAELAGMELLYAVDDDQFDFNDAYTVDNSAGYPTGSFARVAYFVELGPTGNTQWVWVSMDTFNPDPLLVGVPRAGTNIVERGTLVTNLTIESNHPNLAALHGQTGQNGTIEFWSSNYNANGAGQYNSDDGRFDWKDSNDGTTGGGHGSFQVFHLAGTTPDFLDGIGTTLFGITANGGAGIGDQYGPGGGNAPDWTFGPGTGTYQIRNLEIWVEVDATDTDGDGLPDIWEIANLGAGAETDDGTTNPDFGANGDPDGDLLGNLDEFTARTDPNDSDTDDDGYNDKVETDDGTFDDIATDTGTDPLDSDTDDDGLLDGVETNDGTNDGPSDTGTNPLLADTDGDTRPDGYEIANSQDPNDNSDGALDPDLDFSDNAAEYVANTNPNDNDSDDDTLLDGHETNTGTWLSATNTGTDPLDPDTDGDGLPDGVETNDGTNDGPTDTGTNPLLADTDGDAYNDALEIEAGTDPNDINDLPVLGFFPNGEIPDSEKAGMEMLYEVFVPATNPSYRNGTPVPYTVDDSATVPLAYTRIGYYVEVTSGTQAGDWVYISMDTFDADPATLGLPHNVNNPVARQTIVTSANIYSNNLNITAALGSATVNLEMWSTNYANGDSVDIPNGTGRFDWSDTGFGIGAGHGSFQIHNHGLQQTLFGWSDWGGNTPGPPSEFGIGNATALGNPNEDWTFSDDGQSGFVQIVVGTPILEPLRLEVAGNGANLEFRWESQAGKVYDLLSSTDLATDPATWAVWNDNADLEATPDTNLLSIARPGDPLRFFVISEKDVPPL